MTGAIFRKIFRSLFYDPLHEMERNEKTCSKGRGSEATQRSKKRLEGAFFLTVNL
jgi:hypothetical protein